MSNARSKIKRISKQEPPNLPTTSKFQPKGSKAMEAKLQEQLSPNDAEVILGCLPERIRTALIARATEIEYPIEAVIEMAFT